MKCIKHVNLAAGRPRVFVAYLQKMATRNVMTATFGQREGGDTTRQSLGDNRFLNFSPDLPISKFCTQITQTPLCFRMPFVYLLLLLLRLLLLRNWGWLCVLRIHLLRLAAWAIGFHCAPAPVDCICEKGCRR